MIKIVHRLAVETGLNDALVHKLMITAPIRYKTFFIPKRNGRLREISQPAREIKLLQRALIKILLSSLPIHDRATAYRSGLSIYHNAKAHAGSGQILKMDLQNFFPSLKKADWTSYCRKSGCLQDQIDIDLTASLLFRKPPGSRSLQLAIGAPSSPILSNILMFDFDQQISTAVAEEQVTYTRYADDLTFSATRTGYLTRVTRLVASVIKSLEHPRLEINREKTLHVTTKYHRTVTGLTLANDGRVTIGRDKKREVRAAVHRAAMGNLSSENMQILAGMLAYINAVEPLFLEVLSSKYGVQTIMNIQKFVIIGLTTKPGDQPQQ